MHAHEIHPLQIAAVVARGLQTIQRKLSRDVVRRNIPAARARAASLEQIVGEEANMLPDAPCIDPLHRGHDIARQSQLRRRLRTVPGPPERRNGLRLLSLDIFDDGVCAHVHSPKPSPE